MSLTTEIADFVQRTVSAMGLELTPTLTAAEDELVGIAQAIGATGTGVLQVVSDFVDVDVDSVLVDVSDEDPPLRESVR